MDKDLEETPAKSSGQNEQEGMIKDIEKSLDVTPETLQEEHEEVTKTLKQG